MARARVLMDPPPVAYVKIAGPGSGAERNMKQRANAVARRAFILAPKHTGNLARSISVSQNRTERGRFSFGFNVTASASYSGYVHEGTGPSVRQTFPRVMRFMGTNLFEGQKIRTDIVYHPGTPAQPFLTQALTAAAD